MKAFEIFARYSLTYRPVAVFILIRSDHSPGQLTAFCPSGNQYQDEPVSEQDWCLMSVMISRQSQTSAVQTSLCNQGLKTGYWEISTAKSTSWCLICDMIVPDCGVVEIVKTTPTIALRGVTESHPGMGTFPSSLQSFPSRGFRGNLGGEISKLISTVPELQQLCPGERSEGPSPGTECHPESF